MSQTVLTIQTLGFITGTILFGLLLFLSHKAESPAEERRARWLAAAMGLVWNLGSLAEYLLRLGGYEAESPAIRLARAVAYAGTAFLSTAIFMMLSCAPGQASAARQWRWTLPLSLFFGTGLTIGFFATALLWPRKFDNVMLLSAYNLALHLAAGSYLFRRLRERSGYRTALLLSVAIMTGLLFLLIHFTWNDPLETTLTIIAQQSSIPMALIALAWLSQFRFADLFVKQSFLILAAVSLALLYQWFVVTPLASVVTTMSAHSQATGWIVGTLLWAAFLLAFPLLRRKILKAADNWIFERPDYRKLLQEFQQVIAGINEEQALFAVAERCVCEALRVTEAKIREAANEAAFPIRDKFGVRYALHVATGNKPLLSEEITLLHAITELLGRRLEALQFERERQAQALREAKLQQLLTESELRALRAQINPHFLFNTLNTIAALISDAPEKAEQITERLAEVFRYALTRTNRKLIPLAEEFAFLKTYLEIEQARFGERLRVELNFDPTLAAAPIPSLLLQPLVENAIKHGLAAKPEGGTVRVAAVEADAQLQLIVEDDGNGWSNSSSNSHHIGLQNVTERLQMLYGERAQLAIHSAPGHGTRITITLPHDEAEDTHHRRRSVGAVAAEETARRAS
jgi:two-component system LytT family sensor kinase